MSWVHQTRLSASGADFDTRRLFSHSCTGGKFLCAHLKSEFKTCTYRIFYFKMPFFKSLFLLHNALFPMTLLFHVTFHSSGVTALSRFSQTRGLSKLGSKTTIKSCSCLLEQQQCQSNSESTDYLLLQMNTVQRFQLTSPFI